MDKKKGQPKGQPQKDQKTDSTKVAKLKPKKKAKPQKEVGMLKRFVKGKSYHRFTAERLGDHCLHSTVSSLQKSFGVYFDRRRIEVPNRFGSTTRVMLYWLEDAQQEKAIKELKARGYL